MFWAILIASLATLAISFPGHLVLDRLWSLIFGPPLDMLFRTRRRTAALKAMWLDFINMCATDTLALLSGLLILGRGPPLRFFWIVVGIVVASSTVMILIISTRASPGSGDAASHAPATPMMTAGSIVAILVGIILVLSWK